MWLPKLYAQADSTLMNTRIVGIDIEGNRLTKRSIIIREMSWRVGDTIAAAQRDSLTHVNEQRLRNLPLFTSVQLKWKYLTDSTAIVNVAVRERWYLLPEISVKLADRNFNVWWYEMNRDLRRVNVSADIKHSNVFGNLEQMGVILQGGYTQRFGLLYAKPYIDVKQKHGVGANAVYSRSQEMTIGTDSNKLSFARSEHIYVNTMSEANFFYSYRPAYFSRHMVQLSYRNMHITDTIQSLRPQYFLNQSDRLQYAELLYRLDLNYSDNWNYSLTGEKLTAMLIQKVGLKGMNYQTQLQADAMFMRQWAPKWFTALVGKGRLSFPQHQPYPLVQALGYGDKYLRGYEYYVIDGSHYAMGRAAVKYELFKHTFKNIGFRYLPELPLRIYPKIYADAGWVYNAFSGNSFLNNTLLRSAGFGIDIVTAYDIKLKLEYSINHLGERGVYFHQKGD